VETDNTQVRLVLDGHGEGVDQGIDQELDQGGGVDGDGRRPGACEQTLIRPRPGGSVAAEGAGAADAMGGNTLLVPRQAAGKPLLRLHAVPPMDRGTLAEQAATLLCLASRVGQLQGSVDVDQLHHQCMLQVRAFRRDAEQAGMGEDMIRNAQFMLCTLLDESILNTAWGERSRWSQNSLLRIFHRETDGGERVFRIIEQALGGGRRQAALLELAHLCLSLGLAGKYRIDPRGQVRLELIRGEVFRALGEARERHRQALSPTAAAATGMGRGLHSLLPVWLLTASLGLMAFGLYSLLLLDLNRGSDGLLEQAAGLVPMPVAAGEGQQPERSVVVQLRALLATEMDQGVLDVQDSGNRISIVLQAEELFASGSASLMPAFDPVLDKIARALEAIPGRITVAGHTDSLAIRTPRFPSNWHLSLARAGAVAQHLDDVGSLSGRLLPEGRADAQPVADNDTPRGRARNRRVVIEITHMSE